MSIFVVKSEILVCFTAGYPTDLRQFNVSRNASSFTIVCFTVWSSTMRWASQSICLILFVSFGIPTHVSCILIFLIAIGRYRSVRFPTVFASPAVTSISSAGSSESSIAVRSLRLVIAPFLVFLTVLLSIFTDSPMVYYSGVQQILPQPFSDDLKISLSPFIISFLDTDASSATDTPSIEDKYSHARGKS